ncbi:hypothetical protein GTU99_03455 [Streptomyces sp. PRKS01-65]|nr:hypothetical protein [Streptomyces harenosi]NEY31272.1 hypothetical protein [Streptomyces harenosi]
MAHRQDPRNSGPGQAGGTAGAPWWASPGPLGGALLVAAGTGLFLWTLLRSPRTGQEDAVTLYQAARLAAIGLVLAGTALAARRRAPRSGGRKPPGSAAERR